MKVKTTAITCLLLLVSALAPAAYAQSPAATLSGRVVDPQGAAIDNAAVEVTHKTTGARRSTTTNDEGAFSIAGLAVGAYTASVTAPGFATTRFDEVVLVVGQTASLDIALAVESPNEIVEVDDVQAPLIQTVTSVVGGVVGENEIETLPLNGRNFLELALLIPGNSPAPVM